MINLETRKKLKELNFSAANDWCYREEDFCLYDKGSRTCYQCEHYLPNPTLEELIEAITEIQGQELRMDIRPGKHNAYAWIMADQKGMFKQMFKADELDQVLCEALIWLYEQEK